MDQIEFGPYYTWAEARELGVRRRQVLADGRRVSRGLYASAGVSDTLVTRCRAWTRLLPADAAFGLETAGALLGLPVRPPTAVQVVLRPRPVLPQRRGLDVHVRDLRGEDVREVGGLRLTSAPQLFLDLAARLRPADLVAVGDAMMRCGHLSAETLAARLARASRVRGVIRARQCAPMLTPLAMSRPESVMRYWLLTSDLPAPQAQVPIRDRWGHVVVHADLGYPEWRIALEYEGRHHAEQEQFGRDVDRYSLMAADGWLVLRFARRHLAGPAVVIDRTRRALLARGWQ